MAVSLTAAALAEAAQVDTVTATRLLPVVRALVERYASGAPAAIQDEAAIRVAGWLHESPAGSIRSEREGEVMTSYRAGEQSALLHSGAAGLLSPWKVRRAGVI